MFRHLHVLASEQRSMEAMDVETSSCLHVPVRVLLKEPENGQEQGLQDVTPFLLPPFHLVGCLLTMSTDLMNPDMRSVDAHHHTFQTQTFGDNIPIFVVTLFTRSLCFFQELILQISIL